MAGSAGLAYTEGVGTSIAAHTITEDTETRYLERISPGAGVITSFDVGPLTVTATGLVASSSVNTQGKGRIVVSAKAATANGDTCSFRLIYKNGSGDVIATSVLVQALFSELSSGGSPDYRYSTGAAFSNDFCAATAELYVVSLDQNGSTIFSLAAV